MPERPKRRKNNKNKRKNKSNKPDTCKNNDDLNNSDVGETCSNQNINESVLADASESVDETKVVEEDIVVSLKYKDDENLTSVVNESTLIDDLNNNSDQTIGNNFSNSRIDIISDAGAVDCVTYVVEPPHQSLSTNKTKLKNVKSKSLDNEDTTNIIDITEDASETDNENSLALIDSQNVIVTHVDSDIEWEVADNLSDVSQIQETATGTLSITTLPLSIIHSDQNKALSAEEEKSLRSYLKTINLVTQPENINTIEINTEFQEVINQEIKHRLRKRGSADDLFLQRMGPSRILDVIDEEGSSESSMTSRRQSYLSDKKSDIEDIDDDVFEDKNKRIKLKSSNNFIGKRAIGRLIPQECVLVGAKLKDPEVEARGDWTLKTVEKMTGAEIVYLTDTSSSSSSLHEIGDDDDGVETDVSVRMITPTIEVTDTENFFQKSFIHSTNDKTENKTLTELQLSSNQVCNNADRSNEQVDTGKKEHIIKIEYNNDVKEIRQNGQDHFIIKENDKGVGKEYYNNSKNKNKQESNIKHEPIISTKPNERVIEIEMESDANKNKSIQSDSEIVVLSNDNIPTNLYVKDVDENKTTADNLLNTTEKCNEITTKNQGFYHKPESVKIIHGGRKENLQNVTYTEEQNTELSHIQKELLESTKINNEPDIKDSEYALEAKIIKCEFNDAINNLINEVSNEFEAVNETKNLFTRQDSSSSLGSSQCTAKYNPNCESLNDISNIVHDEITFNNKSNAIQSLSTTSHTKDVFERISESIIQKNDNSVLTNTEKPLGLKDLCVLKITTLPYGDKILEELASVSKRLHDFTTLRNASLIMSKDQDQIKALPHCLPDTSIDDKRTRSAKSKNIIPPPVLPRHSSLKKSQGDDQRTTGTSTKSEAGYVCLSPSQKMLMDKTNTVVTEEHSRLYADLSNTVIERDEYIECDKNKKQFKNCNTSESPNLSFKSQTGSRLLALIRDPTLTRNINSLNDRINNSETKRTTTISAENNQESLSRNQNILFKPIPPPRPKKYSTSIYESDESSDFTDNSLRSIKRDRKLFHHSTGTLDKETESDICTIQNMHRFLTDTKGQLNDNQCPRRPSLPKDLCDQQMEYIRKKEKEVDAEIKRLEGFKNNIISGYRTGPKAPLISEREVIDERIKDNNNYSITRKRDVIMSSRDQDIKKGKITSMFNSSQEELLREKMYSEYVTQMAEREERKQHKVIKITNTLRPSNTISKSMSALDAFNTKVNNRIEKEFISKARERWDKLGIKDPETEDERDYTHSVYKEPKVIEHKIKVIESGEEKDVKKLPSHLQEFVNFTAKDKEHSGHSSGESIPGPATPHLVIMCAVVIIVITVGKYFLRLLRYR